MMCDVCKNLSKVYDATQCALVSRFTDRKTGVPTFLIVQEREKGNPQSVVIEVNFCPWCGRRLYYKEDDDA